MSHHHHAHGGHHETSMRRLLMALGLIVGFMMVEVVVGRADRFAYWLMLADLLG